MKNYLLTIAMCGVAAVSYADEETTKTTDTTELKFLAANEEIATTDAEPVKETTELEFLAATDEEIAEAEGKETTELSAWPRREGIFA